MPVHFVAGKNQLSENDDSPFRFHSVINRWGLGHYPSMLRSLLAQLPARDAWRRGRYPRVVCSALSCLMSAQKGLLWSSPLSLSMAVIHIGESGKSAARTPLESLFGFC